MAKDSIRKKIVLALASIMVVAALGTSITAIVMGVKNDGWFGKTDDDKQQEQSDAIDNSGMQVGEIHNTRKISLMSSMKETPTSTSTVTLTATITPADASNKTVNWAIAWKDGASTWATGKTVTDYATITPTTTGALTATVECKKAFGEQIIVTATSAADTDVSASCTFDYAKRITGVTVTGGGTYSNLTVTCTGSNYKDAELSYSPVYSTVYTVEDKFTRSTPAFTPSSAWITQLKTKGISTAASTTVQSDSVIDMISIPMYLGADLSKFLQEKGTKWNAFVNAVNAINNAAVGSITFTYTGSYSKCAFTVDLKLTKGTFALSATNIALNEGGHVF